MVYPNYQNNKAKLSTEDMSENEKKKVEQKKIRNQKRSDRQRNGVEIPKKIKK